MLIHAVRARPLPVRKSFPVYLLNTNSTMVLQSKHAPRTTVGSMHAGVYGSIVLNSIYVPFPYPLLLHASVKHITALLPAVPYRSLHPPRPNWFSARREHRAPGSEMPTISSTRSECRYATCVMEKTENGGACASCPLRSAVCVLMRGGTLLFQSCGAHGRKGANIAQLSIFNPRRGAGRSLRRHCFALL